MRYTNLKTGAVIDSSFIISGGDWVRQQEHKEKQTEVFEDLENKNSEQDINQIDENQQVDTQDLVVENNQEENSTKSSGNVFDDITKEQIIQELKAFGVEHNPRDKKQVLYDLMMQHGK